MITKEELDIKLEENDGLIVLSKGLAIGYNLDTSSFALLTRPDNNFEFGEFGGADIEDHVAINTYEAFNQLEEVKILTHNLRVCQDFSDRGFDYSVKTINELEAQMDNTIKIIDDRIEYHKQKVNRDDWSIGFSDYHRTAIIELAEIKQAIKESLKGDDDNE